MSSFSKQARILAYEALLAHFPNPFLIAMGLERTHGQRLARALPHHMERLRADLKRELRRLEREREAK